MKKFWTAQRANRTERSDAGLPKGKAGTRTNLYCRKHMKLHTEYRIALGKTIDGMTSEERRVYYQLRYKSYSPAQKESHRSRASKWLYANTPKARAANHNRTVLNRYPSIQTSITNEGLAGWLKEQDTSICKYCGDPCPNHIDHIVPLSRGGPHAYENLQLICRKCNIAKSDMTETEFSEWAKRLNF